MVELTIRHPDGSTETIPETSSWTRTRELGSMRRARIDVERSLAEAVTLNQKSDLVDLGTIDTLRLVDVETGGSTWTLVCYSLEWDANREPFTNGGVERTGTDADLITTSIGNVASWSAGTVNSFTGSLAFVFSHAHEHDAIRRVERNTQGELLFRDEGTVDYVDRIGSDKSGSVELSASAGTIEDTIQITKRGRELDGTHIRVLGAHEGEAQLFANLVPQDDPQTYENEVRYSTPRWSDSDDTDWDRWENKDVSDQATIEEEAAALGEELTESLVEAEATVSGVDVALGDTVSVVKSDANLDRDMRIHRIKTVSEGATTREQVLLSTRTTLRQSDSRQLDDIRKFNAGFQGSSVSITGGPLEKAVDLSNSMTLNFRYPDIEFENSAELHVRGLPYRIDSVGAAAGGDHSHLVEVTHPSHAHEYNANGELNHDHTVEVVHPSHDHEYNANGELDHDHTVSQTTTSGQNNEFSNVEETTVSGNTYLLDDTSWSTIDTITPSNPTSLIIAEVSYYTSDPDGYLLYRMQDSTGDSVPSSGGFFTVPIDQDNNTGQNSFTGVIAKDENGSQVGIEMQSQSDSSLSVFVYVNWTVIGKHDHSISVSTTSSSALGTVETSETALGETESSTSTNALGTVETSETALGTTVSESSDASGDHTHPPEPGIYQTSDTPSGVDVIINGDFVATDIGSGTFETVIDISGEMTPGAWNDITLESDSLGVLSATAYVNGYDQIGKQ